MGYMANQLKNLKSEVSNPDWKEPPPLIEDVKGIQDVLDDLESLGCVLINITQFIDYSGINICNYTEFRRVAFNTQTVFYRRSVSGSAELDCYTIFEGVALHYYLSG